MVANAHGVANEIAITAIGEVQDQVVAADTIMSTDQEKTADPDQVVATIHDAVTASSAHSAEVINPGTPNNVTAMKLMTTTVITTMTAIKIVIRSIRTGTKIETRPCTYSQNSHNDHAKILRLTRNPINYKVACGYESQSQSINHRNNAAPCISHKSSI